MDAEKIPIPKPISSERVENKRKITIKDDSSKENDQCRLSMTKCKNTKFILGVAQTWILTNEKVGYVS